MMKPAIHDAPSARADPAERPRVRAVIIVVALWCALYLWRGLVGHSSLETNAFDLSVFDYALWDLSHGGAGVVPFLGHSIFSHHFMPILALLVPFYAAFQSPVFLIVLQILTAAAAALILDAVARRFGVPDRLALALVLVFLLSRRTHSALSGGFYPECLQAVLTFAIVACSRARPGLYWTAVLLMLMTKEDAAIYVAAFGGWEAVRGGIERRRAWTTLTVAVCWAVVSLAIAIPASRTHDGLSAANPLLESRFGSPEAGFDPFLLLRRVANWRVVGRVAALVGIVGFLPVLAAAWIVPALPGLVLNMAAEPSSMQAALTGHYAWPVLPWLMLSAAAGTVWLQAKSPRLARAWILLLVGFTVVDNPALRRIASTQVDSSAREVVSQLSGLSAAVTLAQGNLVPHLPHSHEIYVIGGDRLPDPNRPPDLVLLTPIGDTWPLGAERVRSIVEQYRTNPAYVVVRSGPLFAFKRR